MDAIPVPLCYCQRLVPQSLLDRRLLDGLLISGAERICDTDSRPPAWRALGSDSDWDEDGFITWLIEIPAPTPLSPDDPLPDEQPWTVELEGRGEPFPHLVSGPSQKLTHRFGNDGHVVVPIRVFVGFRYAESDTGADWRKSAAFEVLAEAPTSRGPKSIPLRWLLCDPAFLAEAYSGSWRLVPKDAPKGCLTEDSANEVQTGGSHV